VACARKFLNLKIFVCHSVVGVYESTCQGITDKSVGYSLDAAHARSILFPCEPSPSQFLGPPPPGV
jgi:hypothetical protein